MHTRIFSSLCILILLVILGACQGIYMSSTAGPNNISVVAEQATLNAVEAPALIATYDAQRVVVTEKVYQEEDIYWRQTWPLIWVLLAILGCLMAIMVYLYIDHGERDLRERIQFNKHLLRSYRDQTTFYQFVDTDKENRH
jgi:hypothetical protein